MDKLLLEYPWLPKVVAHSKDYGLDWLMMAALALELSGGDPRCRTLDREFLMEHMAPDCPLVAAHWDYTGLPDIEIIDMATRWGLFQILGRVAKENGVFTGRTINFIDIGSNVRAACEIFSRLINDGATTDKAIIYFGADPKRVKTLMHESRASFELLLSITQEMEDEQ